MGSRRRPLLLVALLTAAAGVAALPASATTNGGEVADRYTRTAPGALAPGQIELAVTSTRPSVVTGGDARMRLRGLDPADRFAVRLDDGTDVTGWFTRTPDGTSAGGVVRGLPVGTTTVHAIADGPAGIRGVSLDVTNHPITGPVISGPHQEPFICETERAGLGPPLDDDCSVTPVVQWYRRLAAPDASFVPLDDPYAPYPADTATTTTRNGDVVPFVVRIESRTINRSITRIAVLDDPAGRGRGVPYAPTPGWNRSAIYQFGESCGTGYHQGVNHVDTVLGGDGLSAENIAGLLVQPAARIGEGYAYVHSTLTIFGVHCNQVLSAETMMMVKEHLVEAYGPVQQVLGVGASGGALQQYTIIDGYPGLLDAGVPILSFPDVVTTAMSTVDCGLLDRVFENDPDRWSELDRTAVSGLNTSQQCQDWVDNFLDRLDPDGGCAGALPPELRYDAETNPDGARCTVQDSNVNLMGRDPETGFARRPIDNTGVQYGLVALWSGQITVDDFLVLNRTIGGYDIDGNWVPERMSMPADLAEDMYRYGGVTGRGAPEGTPIIDIRLQGDFIPVLGFHDNRRPYMFEDRLAARGLGDSYAIWTGVPLPSDALRVAHQWADAIDAAYPPLGDRAGVVGAAAPPEGSNRCTAPTAIELAGIPLGPAAQLAIPGCEEALWLTTRTSPRIAAGGPTSEDVIKCQLRAPTRTDYPASMTDAQFAELQGIFPTGICDWSRPGVGEVERGLTWVSVGAEELAPEPFQVPDVVARSRIPTGS